MGLISYLRGDGILGQKAITGTAGVLETIAARQFNGYIPLGRRAVQNDRISGAYVAVQNASYGWIYRYTPGVREVVDYIARNVSSLGLKVYKRISDDEREHVGDHPAARALRNPNPQTPGQQFIFSLVADKLIYDNAYALKIRSTQLDGLTLVGLPPHLVGIVGQSHFQVEAYRIWRLDGSFFDVAPEDVLHWRGYNPDDPRRGESVLETLREELASDAASRQATTELHKSGLSLPGWIERPLEAPPWSQEGRERFQEGMAAQARQSKRRYPVLEEGMVFKQSSVTPEDAELLATRRWTEELIAGQFGLVHCPPESEEERTQFYADVLAPLTESLCSFLDLHVLQAEFGAKNFYTELNLDEKLMGDDRLKAFTSAAGAPVLTRNEARARLNLPPKQGGDDLVTPMNVTEGGKPSPQVMPIQNPNGPPQDGSHRSGEADQPARAGSRSLNGHAKAVPTNGKVQVVEYDPEVVQLQKATPLLPRRRQIDHRRNRWATSEYEPLLQSFFERQERVTKSKKLKSVTDERWDKELADDLEALYLRQFTAEGKHAAFRLAVLFEPKFGLNWLASKAAGVARDINRITQEHIDQDGFEEAFARAKDQRVPAAAKAMATDIAGFSTKVVTEQAHGDPWVTIDGGECDVCAPYQGTWRASELDAWPAYHAGCNCLVDVTADAVKSVESNEQTETIQILVKALVNGNRDEGIQALAKAISEQKPPNVTVEPAQTIFQEGAVNAQTTVEAPPPAEVTFAEGAIQTPVTVEAAKPANVTISKDAVALKPQINVQAPPAPPPAEVHVSSPPVNVAPAEVRLAKGAINVEAPPPANVNVEAPPPANVTVEAPPPAEVNVQAAPPANVNVEVHSSGRKTVEFSDGTTAEIREEDGRPDEG